MLNRTAGSSKVLKLATAAMFSVGCASQRPAAAVRSDPTLTADLERVRSSHGVPGMGAAIVHDWRISIAVSGRRRIDRDAPLLENDEFHLGSDTKAMTASVVALRERSSARTTVLASGLVLAGLVLLLAPRLFADGSPSDEGTILSYADRILHGAVPIRDFETFYGPLNPLLVAGVFKLVGPSFYAERIVGILYRLLLAGALLALVRRRGAAPIAVAGGLKAFAN